MKKTYSRYLVFIESKKIDCFMRKVVNVFSNLSHDKEKIYVISHI